MFSESFLVTFIVAQVFVLGFFIVLWLLWKYFSPASLAIMSKEGAIGRAEIIAIPLMIFLVNYYKVSVFESWGNTLVIGTTLLGLWFITYKTFMQIRRVARWAKFRDRMGVKF